MTEEWRTIPGHPDYSVSSTGRVCSRKQQGSARILKQSPDKDGYARVCLDRKTRRVHSLVALAFLGEVPEGCTLVRHLDGDNTNNNLSNLKWGTLSENMYDRVAHGRNDTGGEKNGRAKLTKEQVDQIRSSNEILPLALWEKKLLAQYWKISVGHLNKILRGGQW